MSETVSVTVQRAIVHIVNHKKRKLVLSSDELELKGNDDLRTYFSEQVANARDDPQTQSARFSGDQPVTARDDCFRILKDGRRFIATSQSLANLLFKAMFREEDTPDERIAAGSLAVCVYTEGNAPTKSLALIKLDPSDAFVQKVTPLGDGKQMVNFDIRKDVMPTTSQQLQKAAIVLPEGSDEERQLLLLDRQTRETAANFFARAFLNAVPVYSPEQMTDLFYLAVRAGLDKLLKPTAKEAVPITPKDAVAVVQQLDATLQAGNEIETEDFVNDLPEPARPAIRSEMRKRLKDKRVIVAPGYAQATLLKKKRFRGEYGVVFEVEAKYYEEVVTNEQHDIVLTNGKTGSRLTIEVPKFHPIV